MDRRYETWVSAGKELPYFGSNEVIKGPKVDIHVNNMGVAITPNFFDSSCAEHFSNMLGETKDIRDAIYQNLRNAIRNEAIWNGTFGENEDFPVSADYPVELNLFNMGYFAKNDVLVVQDGIHNPCIYWDHAASGKLNKDLASSEGLVQLVDLFKRNSSINSFPMRAEGEIDSKPLLVFSPNRFNLLNCNNYGTHKVLLHDKYQVG